jgi:hypothetical protein
MCWSRPAQAEAVGDAGWRLVARYGLLLAQRAVDLCRCSGKAARAASLLGSLSAMALLRDEIPLALVYANDAADLLRDEPTPSPVL